jgi:hypothetical protein
MHSMDAYILYMLYIFICYLCSRNCGHRPVNLNATPLEQAEKCVLEEHDGMRKVSQGHAGEATKDPSA